MTDNVENIYNIIGFPAIHAESSSSGYKSEPYRSSNANDMEVVETPLNPFVRGEFFAAVVFNVFNNDDHLQSIL